MTADAMEHLAEVARKEGVRNVVWSGMTKREGKEVAQDRESVVNCG